MSSLVVLLADYKSELSCILSHKKSNTNKRKKNYSSNKRYMPTILSFGPHQVVTAGGTLNGTLNITTTKSIKATRLHVYFRGKEYTSARIQSGKNSHTVQDKKTFYYVNLPGFQEINNIIIIFRC